MSKPIIEVENLGKRYRIGGERERYLSLRDELAKKLSPAHRRSEAAKQDFWALKDVSFSVEEGEAVGIIGRNGAGKSTLLKILSQITPPTTGKITMRGRVASLLEVGTGFHPELTGRENIYLNGAVLGMTRREIARKFDEIVAFAEVDKFLDTPVKRYSSGMYVRLAFAVAAHLEPEILVVDEVLAVGDAQFQQKCLGKMGEVAKGGRTVLFVSHNMAAIRILCGRALVLVEGQKAFYGSVESGISAYLGPSGMGGERLLDRFTVHDRRLSLDTVEVNGSALDRQGLAADQDRLTLLIRGRASEDLAMDLEVRLLDAFGSPLAFFTPGHERGQPLRVTAGAFALSYEIRLPRLFKGTYQLSLYLTHPGKFCYAEAVSGLCLEYEGTPTATGHVFSAASGSGFFLLEGSLTDGATVGAAK